MPAPAFAWLLLAQNIDAKMSDTKIKPSAERKENFTTLSGLPIDRLYTQDDLSASDPESSIGYPGEFPYTRGIYPTMYRGRL